MHPVTHIFPKGVMSLLILFALWHFCTFYPSKSCYLLIYLSNDVFVKLKTHINNNRRMSTCTRARARTAWCRWWARVPVSSHSLHSFLCSTPHLPGKKRRPTAAMRGSCRPSNTRDRAGKKHTAAELSFLFILLLLFILFVGQHCARRAPRLQLR